MSCQCAVPHESKHPTATPDHEIRSSGQFLTDCHLASQALPTHPRYIPTEHIIVGDFNIKHPLWSGTHISPDPHSGQFLDLIDSLKLTSLLKHGTITREAPPAQPSIINLLLVTPGLVDNFFRYRIKRNLADFSDHYSIEMIFAWPMSKNQYKKVWNWDKTDHMILTKILKNKFLQSESLIVFTMEKTQTNLDNYTECLVEMIILAIV